VGAQQYYFYFYFYLPSSLQIRFLSLEQELG